MSFTFIPGEAEGAIPNGSRVRKTNSDDGDTHRDGALAKVLSSVGPIQLEVLPEDLRLPGNEYAYFIEWDDLPGLPVAISGHRVERAP